LVPPIQTLIILALLRPRRLRHAVYLLEQTDTGWEFAFVPDDDLVPFTRHNWKWV